jgi:hypothetical protein
MFCSSFVNNTYPINEKVPQVLENLTSYPDVIGVLSSRCCYVYLIRILACFPALAPTIMTTAIAIQCVKIATPRAL